MVLPSLAFWKVNALTFLKSQRFKLFFSKNKYFFCAPKSIFLFLLYSIWVWRLESNQQHSSVYLACIPTELRPSPTELWPTPDWATTVTHWVTTITHWATTVTYWAMTITHWATTVTHWATTVTHWAMTITNCATTITRLSSDRRKLML